MKLLPQSARFKDIVTLAVLSLIWGSSFILIKKGLVSFSPPELAALRIVIAAVAFSPILFFVKTNLRKRHLLPLAVAGIMGSGIPAYLFAMAEMKVSSSIAGILNSLTPVFTLILGLAFYHVKALRLQILGVFLGLVGAVSLLGWGHHLGAENDVVYGLLAVIGTVCYAISVNTVKRYLQDVHPLIINVVSFLIIGVPYGIYLLGTSITAVFVTDPQAWTSFGYVAILSLAGTFLAMIIFYRLVQRTDAVFASSVAYVIPIVAIFWGWVDGEVITILHFLSIALIIYGVYLIRKKT